MVIFSSKSKFKKAFSRLKNRFDELNSNNLDTKINKLKKISENNKEYANMYEEINTKYKELINTYDAEMSIAFNKVDVLLSEKDTKNIKDELASMEKVIDDYERELRLIEEDILSITSKEDELREFVVPLKEKFRTLKASFYEHKEELSVCSKVFEKKINELEKTIAKLDTKLENAYYKEASQLINELTRDIEFYEGHLEKMPQLVSFSMQVLPNRLDSAIKRYQKMKEEGYPLFSIKVSNIEEKIRNSLEEIKIRFLEFNYDDINESIKEAVYDIENLSEALEKEVTAKDHFTKYIDTVYAKIDEIGKKFLKTKRDTNGINGVYLIGEDKFIELSSLENGVHILNRIKMELDAYIHSATKQPYSMLTSKMGELAEYGAEIENRLTEHQNYILSLKNDSEYAYEKVNNYSVELNTLYSTLVSLNHKVLSVIYEEEYKEAASLIEEISKRLKTSPINVEYINENIKGLSSKIEKLLIDMKNSIKMYKMAQNIIVFTNKYRSSFSTVNEVLNRAEIHFNSGEFEFAIDSVSEVLQEVHPRAYEEMMKRKGHKDE